MDERVNGVYQEILDSEDHLVNVDHKADLVKS